MKLLSEIQYPKFLLLLLTFLIAYLIFTGRNFLPLHNTLLSFGYVGTFFAGIFFAYGFTAAPATAVLLILSKEQNVFFAGFIAGLGALVGDLLIFKLIRHSFSDEIKKLSREKGLVYISKKLRKVPLFEKFKKILWLFLQAL